MRSSSMEGRAACPYGSAACSCCAAAWVDMVSPPMKNRVLQRPASHRAMRDTCSCMHEETSGPGVPRHLWHSCDKCENRAKIVPWGAAAPASLARVRPPGSAHMPESPWAAPLHQGGRDTRDDGAMGRRRRVPGG